MDEQVVPALYAALGAAFAATPSQLGMLVLARALVQAASSPLGGFLGQYQNRAAVTGAGCLLWGFMTTALGAARSLREAVLLYGVNGLGLAMVIPNTQSLTADYHAANARGAAFGWLYLTSALGGMLGSLLATNLGGQQVAGLAGWRVVLLAVGCASGLTGLATLLLAADPNYTPAGHRKAPLPPFGLRSAAGELWQVVRVPTFLIIVMQGIVGTSAWSALVFLTLYFQLLSMSNAVASGLVALLLGGSALGGLLGGWVGDRAAERYPDHGRILVCQLSVASGIPAFYLLLKHLPQNAEPASIAAYACLITATALLKTWAAPACNNPIMAEIVPPHLRNMVFAFDRCFEGALAALVAPVVGWVAEAAFGFGGAATPSGDVALDLQRAQSLGNALLLFTVLPWSLCLLFYTGLHFTYPADRRHAAEVGLTVLALSSAAGEPVHQHDALAAWGRPSAVGGGGGGAALPPPAGPKRKRSPWLLR